MTKETILRTGPRTQQMLSPVSECTINPPQPLVLLLDCFVLNVFCFLSRQDGIKASLL